MKPGFKQTDVGVIPEEWEVKSLASLAERIMVGIASAATHAYRTKGVPLFRNQNIKSGFLDDGDLLFVDPEYEKTFKNKRLRGGDLLTARTGYPGTTCVVPPSYDSAQSFTTLITRPNTAEIDSSFLCLYINSEEGQKFFEQGQIGGAQKNVNAGTLRKMPVPIPPPPEQRAIATALSDMDVLLASLNRLIAKKRDIKQAAMQQLLTGQTRLPGAWNPKYKDTEIGKIPEDWDVKSVRDIGKIQTGPFGTLLKADEYSGTEGVPLISVGEVGAGSFKINEHTPRVPHAVIRRLPQYVLRKGDIVFGRKGAVDRSALVTDAEDGWFLGSDGISIRPQRSCYPPYLAWQFQRYEVQAWLLQNAIGTTMASLNQGILNRVQIPYAPLPEQTAIAGVLSDMDAELVGLEQRRDKTRALKQAIMQELLTGRTRLV